MSSKTGAPLPSVLPIDINLRKGRDTSIPLMVENPDSPTGCIFRKIAIKVVNSNNS